MREIKAIIRTDRLQDVVHALQAVPNMPGLTVSTVRGFGRRASGVGPGLFSQTDFTKLEAVIDDEAADGVVAIIVRHAHTGGAGDGKIFVTPVLQVIEIRQGVPE